MIDSPGASSPFRTEAPLQPSENLASLAIQRRVKLRFGLAVLGLFIVVFAVCAASPFLEELTSPPLYLDLPPYTTRAILLWGVCLAAVSSWAAGVRALARLTSPSAGEIARLERRCAQLEKKLVDETTRQDQREKLWGEVLLDVRARGLAEAAESFGLASKNHLSLGRELVAVLKARGGDEERIAELERQLAPVSSFCEASLAVAGSRDSTAEWFNLNALVTRVSSLIAARVNRTGAPIALDLEPRIPPVKGRPFRVCMAVLEALANSAEAMVGRREASVKVVTRQVDGKVVLQIVDARGLTEVGLYQVVGPDVLKEGAEYEGRHGYYLVKTLCEQDGIDFALESTPDHKATTLSLTFPPATAGPGEAVLFELPADKLLLAMELLKASEGTKVEWEGQLENLLTGKRILVADLDASVVERCAATLRRAGAVVDAASTGPDAQSRISSTRYDIIVTDCRITGQDTDSLTSFLAHQQARLSKQLIFTTDSTVDPEIVQFLEEFKFMRLEKPFSDETLIQIVSRTLAAAESARRAEQAKGKA